MRATTTKLLPVAALALLAAGAAMPAAQANPLETGGVSITRGGHNTNTASGRFSSAFQDTTTVGGQAVGRGARAVTLGGLNSNRATGAHSLADQQVSTVGGLAQGRRAQSFVAGGMNSNLASGRHAEAYQQ